MRTFGERWRRAREVTATIVQVDRATEKVKAVPTFAYRTFDGHDIQARSAVNFDGKRELELLVVGSAMRVRYDPQQPDWVVPALVEYRKLVRSALWPGITLTVMGIACSLGWLIPE